LALAGVRDEGRRVLTPEKGMERPSPENLTKKSKGSIQNNQNARWSQGMRKQGPDLAFAMFWGESANYKNRNGGGKE